MTRLIKESVQSQVKCRSRIIDDMLVRPADAIVQLAEKEAADLIVLASHGQRSKLECGLGYLGMT